MSAAATTTHPHTIPGATALPPTGGAWGGTPRYAAISRDHGAERPGVGSSEHRANTAFFRIMETAPLGLLISAALGLALVGVFQYIFYLDVLPAGWAWFLRATLSTGLAAFFEGLGFYFLVATVRDFSGGHRREGYIGLTATFLLWAYALWEAHHISTAFDAGGKYWAIMGIIGTIVCVVRVVELRITLTVTSAYQRQSEVDELRTTLQSERKQRLELTGKVNHYEAEKRRIEQEKAEAEKNAFQAEQQRIEQEKALREMQMQQENENLQNELADLRKKVDRAEKRSVSAGNTQPVDRNKRPEIERRVQEFYRKNNVVPTQDQAAKLVGLKDARALRYHFQNGSWDKFVESLQPEKATA